MWFNDWTGWPHGQCAVMVEMLCSLAWELTGKLSNWGWFNLIQSLLWCLVITVKFFWMSTGAPNSADVVLVVGRLIGGNCGSQMHFLTLSDSMQPTRCLFPWSSEFPGAYLRSYYDWTSWIVYVGWLQIWLWCVDLLGGCWSQSSGGVELLNSFCSSWDWFKIAWVLPHLSYFSWRIGNRLLQFWTLP